MFAWHDMRFLLDEHYPPWLADELVADGLDVDAVLWRDDLRGASDNEILAVAAREERILVTEDARTMPFAARLIPEHAGIVFCPSRRFGRDRAALNQLRQALWQFAAEPPSGASTPGFVWWLQSPS